MVYTIIKRYLKFHMSNGKSVSGVVKKKVICNKQVKFERPI